MKFEKNLKANKKLSALFFTIMIVAIISMVSRWSKESTPENVEPVDGASTVDSSFALTRRIDQADRIVVLHKDWGKDPFSPRVKRSATKGTAVTGRGSGTGFTLSGILTDGRRSTAVINGEVYTGGQIIAGYMIEEILSGTVKLRKGNRTLVLKL